jgi:hypothetical protein
MMPLSDIDIQAFFKIPVDTFSMAETIIKPDKIKQKSIYVPPSLRLSMAGVWMVDRLKSIPTTCF